MPSQYCILQKIENRWFITICMEVWTIVYVLTSFVKNVLITQWILTSNTGCVNHDL